jgi:hypothetical protein
MSTIFSSSIIYFCEQAKIMWLLQKFFLEVHLRLEQFVKKAVTGLHQMMPEF